MNIYNHLHSRHLNPSLYPNMVIDEASNIATFPLFSFDYRMVGYQQYNPAGIKSFRRNPKLGRYYTYTSEPAVWGLESLHFTKNLVFVLEGVFDACRFHNYSYPAIAALTNNPVPLKEQILNLASLVIAVCDPDEAGMKLSSYGHLYVIPDKPVDDMTELEFEKFLGTTKNSKNVHYTF